ncbi:MAG TPA: EF-hand domain-containing protein [Edaphobacter sp.]
MNRTYVLLSLLLFVPPVLAQRQGNPPPRPVLLALDTNHDGSLSAEEIIASSTVLLTLDTDHDAQLTSLEYLPSQADPDANKPDETVQRLMALDRNQDGVLTKDEVPERLQGLLSRADADHDGKLTPAEIRASATSQAAPRGRAQHSGDATRMDPILNALDADHDGILSASEIAAAPTALKTIDKDGDGELSSAELRPKQMTPTDRAKHMLDEWDTNKDGKITKPESHDRMQSQFESIDTNHDGVLTEDELTVYFANMPQQQPRREGGNNQAPGQQGPRP